MIYDNPYPGQELTYTCPRCGGTFKQGNTRCLVMHYGSGCCHYGDTPVFGRAMSEAEPVENQPVQPWSLEGYLFSSNPKRGLTAQQMTDRAKRKRAR